ncbi:MAG TPA: hypothetical protein VN784_12175 [Candidatus Limnocylindrales bacterium]|nr:hypothetical protein [Candidatus Limnocylindrales bacterium]
MGERLRLDGNWGKWFGNAARQNQAPTIADFMKRFFAVLLILISGCKPATAPTADLASPSQATRDATAKILRATAKPPSKLKWFFFTCHIRNGEDETNILALLRSYKLSAQPETGFGGIGEYREYRLDDYWLLGCEFNNNDIHARPLTGWKLVSRWRDYFMLPATNFSGVWITYYANGQKSSEANYTNGSRSGEFTSFYPNGSKSQVWHYENWKANGLYTQYFPSGQIQYQVQYSNNVRVGFGVWYNKDGSTNHVTDYSKP